MRYRLRRPRTTRARCRIVALEALQRPRGVEQHQYDSVAAGQHLGRHLLVHELDVGGSTIRAT